GVVGRLGIERDFEPDGYPKQRRTAFRADFDRSKGGWLLRFIIRTGCVPAAVVDRKRWTARLTDDPHHEWAIAVRQLQHELALVVGRNVVEPEVLLAVAAPFPVCEQSCRPALRGSRACAAQIIGRSLEIVALDLVAQEARLLLLAGAALCAISDLL